MFLILNDWVYKNESLLIVIAIIITGFILVFAKEEYEIYAYLVPMIGWLMSILNRKLLGVGYPNKVNVFFPGKDWTTGQTLSLLFSLILCVSVLIMIKNGMMAGFFILYIFMLFSFAVGSLKIINSLSKVENRGSKIKKIIALNEKLIFYADEKIAFNYDESRWKLKHHDEIIIYNKYDISNNIVVYLADYKALEREPILNEISSRMEKGLV